MIEFSAGLIKTLVTKPSIAGFGMNWQNCSKMIFVGLSDSYEAYYQAIRRCWRFGQKSYVDVYIVVSDREGLVRENILRKEADAQKMTAEMVKYTKDILTKEIHNTTRVVSVYDPKVKMVLPYWRELIA
jgi:superfamily II DNA helicase RecQ